MSKTRFIQVNKASNFICQRCGKNTESHVYDVQKKRAICEPCKEAEIDEERREQEGQPPPTPEQDINSQAIAMLLTPIERIGALEMRVQSLEKKISGRT